jgi:nucleoside-diphosphate-sugar epimerase
MMIHRPREVQRWCKIEPRLCAPSGDLLDLAQLTRAMEGCDLVWHLAANADVRFGARHPRKDLEQNTLATFNVLEAIRKNGVKQNRVCLHGIDLW